MIEEFRECIEELCLKCGRYEQEHEGACDGCKWYRIKSGEKSKKYDDALLDCADDLMFNCSTESCQDYERDEFGNEYVKHTCPFFVNGACAIGDPESWRIGRSRK